VKLNDIAPAARGVAAEVGPRERGRTGRGGTGDGTGEGVGSGSGDAPVAKVVSVASIKKMAVPKGDYDYFDAQKQYPAEARQLGVGGVIRVQLTIDATGKVIKVRLLGKGLGHGLDELALRRARTLQFEPALDTDNQPVTSVLTWTFRFEVPS
jgi:protein TonB